MLIYLDTCIVTSGRIYALADSLHLAAAIEFGCERLITNDARVNYDHRPEVIVQRGQGWYTEPHHRFEVGFVEDVKPILRAPRLFRSSRR